MSGEFTIVNKYLVDDLKKLNLWNQDMLDRLKYYDGNVSMIEQLPLSVKEKYKEAFEIDPLWLIQVTAARGKWIDQSQSHNVFMRGVSGQMLNDIYLAAWQAPGPERPCLADIAPSLLCSPQRKLALHCILSEADQLRDWLWSPVFDISQCRPDIVAFAPAL